MQRAFFEKEEKLYNVIKNMGNSFQEETSELLTLDTEIITIAIVAKMVVTHYQNGMVHFKEFMKGLEREEGCTFYEPVKKNKLDISEQKPEPASGDLKQKILNEDCHLFSKLFTSCQSRECDLLLFFWHEIQSIPAVVSDWKTP